MYIRPLWSCGGEWNNKMEMISCVNSKGFADESTWIFWVNFGWTWYHFYFFFASFALICQRSPLKKSSGHWEAREAQNRYLRREVGKETDIGEGMGGELRVREKNTLHALQVRYLHLTETRNTVNLYITRKSFTRIEKEKSIWKQEVS